jgi:hypothetical protein
MTISRRVMYQWSCERCGSPQEAIIWRILDARERSDVIERGGQELGETACGECGNLAEIDEPLLVIRPVDAVPLLLGLPVLQLDNPETAESRACDGGGECSGRHRRHPQPDDPPAQDPDSCRAYTQCGI